MIKSAGTTGTLGDKNSDGIIEKDSWCTPSEIVELVKCVFGGKVELDPATNNYGQKTICAKNYCVSPDDRSDFSECHGKKLSACGLATDWNKYKSVFANPPYSRELMNKFCEKYIQYSKNRSGKIALLKYLTGSKIDHELMRISDFVFLIKRRLRFLNCTSGKESSSSIFNSVIYFSGVDLKQAKKLINIPGTILKCQY